METAEHLWQHEQIPMTTNPLRFFIFASRPHWRLALVAVMCVTTGTIVGTTIPYVFKLIVDNAARIDTVGVRPLAVAVLLYVAANLARSIVWRASGFAGAFWATGARATAREALSSFIVLHSRAYFADHFAGSLANKISHASNGMREFVEQLLWQFLSFGLNVIFATMLLFWVNPLIGLSFFVWVAVVIPWNVYRARIRMPIATLPQRIETKLTGATVDLLSNISSMQEYARRDYEVERLQGIIAERQRTGLRNWHFGEWTLTSNGVLQAALVAGLSYVIVAMVGVGRISPGDIVLILTLIYRLDEQFIFLGSHINQFSEQWSEVKESLEEIMVPHDIADKQNAALLGVRGGVISFDTARFAYGDATVFPGLSFTIPGGQRVGLVGKSGAGKSTLIRLLLRHHELSGGAIRIDGTGIAEVTQDSLRSSVAVVPQESLLFHRSIRENIRYGRPEATDAEVEEAAKRAQAHAFIARLSAGYDSLVGERGVKLSGGERQRIAIARAILKDAPILVLDEATASLDSESEIRIQEALHELMQGKTVIAIAHRLSTLREMDRIIVLDKGAIAEDGTHDELLARGGIYGELWQHQAGGFIPDDGDEEVEA
jgi:ATP-binding cassette subfamily B protein